MPDATITVHAKHKNGMTRAIRAERAAKLRADRIRYRNTGEKAFRDFGTDWSDWYVMECPA
jgi:hypothetical protein